MANEIHLKQMLNIVEEMKEGLDFDCNMGKITYKWNLEVEKMSNLTSESHRGT